MTGEERPTWMERPLEQKERAGNGLASPSSHLPTSHQCLPWPRGTEASWPRGLGTRVLQGWLPAPQATAGWAADSTSLPNVSFLFSPSLLPSIPRPLRHGMPKQLDWVESFAPALSANHPAAFTMRSERLTTHT